MKLEYFLGSGRTCVCLGQNTRIICISEFECCICSEHMNFSVSGFNLTGAKK